MGQTTSTIIYRIFILTPYLPLDSILEVFTLSLRRLADLESSLYYQSAASDGFIVRKVSSSLEKLDWKEFL
jgi:hypothetical protein